MLVFFYLNLFFNILIVSKTEEYCISGSEMELYHLINRSREAKGLSSIELSPSLSLVAQLHCEDLNINEPFSDRCNPHSWSGEGSWKECCYKNDHSNAACMWDKPRELTDYQGDGYEIVAFWQSGTDITEEISPEKALDLWLDSKGHRSVILNEGIFNDAKWNAVGVGIYGNYSAVWFGMEEDPHQELIYCTD